MSELKEELRELINEVKGTQNQPADTADLVNELKAMLANSGNVGGGFQSTLQPTGLHIPVKIEGDTRVYVSFGPESLTPEGYQKAVAYIESQGLDVDRWKSNNNRWGRSQWGNRSNYRRRY